jgi:hypothetical protein
MYIPPLELELASTGYKLDLKRVMDIGECLREGKWSDMKG